MRALAAALLLPSAAGHGSMHWPPSRTGKGWAAQSTLWFNVGCQPGCDKCVAGDCYGLSAANAHEKCCDTVTPPTMADDSALRTYPIEYPNKGPFFGGNMSVSQYNPWRSPGFAPVENPCGVAGGSDSMDILHHPGAGEMPPLGYKMGFPGTMVPELKGVKTVWKAGSQEEVAWWVQNNHGGGYSYRLCRKVPGQNITEECFQKGALSLVGDQSYIQYGDYDGTATPNRTAIPAMRTTSGTNPPGSQWTRSPIPPCAGTYGGGVAAPGCELGPQYTAPLAGTGLADTFGDVKTQGGIYGFGWGRCAGIPPGVPSPQNPKELLCTLKENKFWKALFHFSIIDIVQVPADLPPGDYVLGFRWDCEQTPQVWQNCADVTITA